MGQPNGPKAELDQEEDDGDALVSEHPQEQEKLSVLLGRLVEQLPGRDVILRTTCQSVSGKMIGTVWFLAVRSPTVRFWAFRTFLTIAQCEKPLKKWTFRMSRLTKTLHEIIRLFFCLYFNPLSLIL